MPRKTPSATSFSEDTYLVSGVVGQWGASMATAEGHNSQRRSAKGGPLSGAPLRRAMLAAMAGWSAAAAPLLSVVAQSPAALVIIASPFLVWLSIYFLAEHLLPSWTAGLRATLAAAIYFLIGAVVFAVIIALRVDFELPTGFLAFFSLVAWPLMVVGLSAFLLHLS